MNAGHCDASLHYITEASLADLRSRVNNESVEVTNEQFRPNFVIEGNKAYEEDKMKELVICNSEDKDDVNIKVAIVKPCFRCKS